MYTGKVLFMLVFIPASVLLFSAGMPLPHLPAPAIVDAPVLLSASKMWVENENVFLGETIHLRFKTPNPHFLGVVDPSGKFFYIVFPASESAGKLTPLVDSKIFNRLDRLSIFTASFKADPYTYGVMENQTVFVKSGTYTFILGNNLHTDDPTVLSRVKVKYNNTIRPGQSIVVLN